MNALEQEINDWLCGDVVPSVDRVDELQASYPYFVLPAVVLAARQDDSLSPDIRNRLCRSVALNTPDHEALRAVLDSADGEFTGFYPPVVKEPAPTTVDAIDKFINTYGGADPNEEAVLMRMIFNPTPDYAQVLAAQEQRSAPQPDEAPAGSHDQLINDFILKTRAAALGSDEAETPAGPAPVADPLPQHPTPGVEESMLSESLAKIYIGQHRYAKAYEIISNLNLNFPEKSIYFADQLRFLRKLMVAQKYADNQKNN